MHREGGVRGFSVLFTGYGVAWPIFFTAHVLVRTYRGRRSPSTGSKMPRLASGTLVSSVMLYWLITRSGAMRTSIGEGCAAGA